MSFKIYLSGAFELGPTMAKLAEQLTKAGHQVLCPWWEPAPWPDSVAAWARIGDMEAEAIREADLMLVLWKGPSIGTAMELGMRREGGNFGATIIFPMDAAAAATLHGCPFLYDADAAGESQFLIHPGQVDADTWPGTAMDVVAEIKDRAQPYLADYQQTIYLALGEGAKDWAEAVGAWPEPPPDPALACAEA